MHGRERETYHLYESGSDVLHPFPRQHDFNIPVYLQVYLLQLFFSRNNFYHMKIYGMFDNIPCTEHLFYKLLLLTPHSTFLLKMYKKHAREDNPREGREK